MTLAKHLYLIGYRGSGKTTIGMLLAQQLKAPFIDSDQRITQREGRTIKEIFDAGGESLFRDIESAVIREIAGLPDAAIVSLGGGAILREENRNCISRTGDCIWLTASPENLFARINQDQTSSASRPQLTDRAGYEEVVELLNQRTPLYADLAKKTVETDSLTPEEIVREIVDWVKSTY